MRNTHRETLPQHTGLLELPGAAELLHVSAEVTLSALRSHTGLAALTPAGGQGNFISQL